MAEDGTKSVRHQSTPLSRNHSRKTSRRDRFRSGVRRVTSRIARWWKKKILGKMDDYNRDECLQIVERINNMLDNNPSEYMSYVESARRLMNTCDSLHFFDDSTQLDAQMKVVETLQRLAFVDIDSGPVNGIADWCLQRWLRMLQNNPEAVDILKGIGKWWLNKAQPSLARINAEETSSSSSSAGASRGARPHSDSTTHHRAEEARPATRSTDRRDAEAETRLHTQEYVEARGILLPAIEYLRRAVEEADSQGVTNGSLLVTAAEAFMSLGNVSYARMNTEYFRQAIVYLRRASGIPGFPLPAHLQRYLDDYGRFVD